MQSDTYLFVLFADQDRTLLKAHLHPRIRLRPGTLGRHRRITTTPWVRGNMVDLVLLEC